MKMPFPPSPVSRRDMLSRCASGFGALAAAALFHHAPRARAAASLHAPGGANDDSESKGLLFPPRARAVIFLYMDGGPSQVDTFDPKPILQEYDGKPFPMKMEPTQFNNYGATLGSPWSFEKYGQSGIPVSSLFPHVAQCVDDLAIIRSMTSEFSEHTNANYLLHTGSGLQGRPSMGAWIGYGLGSENRNLPGFVVLNGGLVPPGGLDNFNSGFLPATFQGSVFKPGPYGMANIQPTETLQGQQERKLALTRALDRGLLARAGHVDQLESAIANAELAFRMQSAVPELMSIEGETEANRNLYGFNAQSPLTRTFAGQCLQARRLVERGVRFIELTCPSVGADRWDQHGNLRDGHEKNALAVDQPIAALLKDLKSRGLLDSTLVVWGGEFGRTPFAQGRNGRDHNPFGFTMWMAGGGVRGGVVRGATDDFGYKAVEDVASIHDLHATILYLLGIDHTRLTFRFSGRDIRLTDVHGEVMHSILV
jgi:hypothetical protein